MIPILKGIVPHTLNSKVHRCLRQLHTPKNVGVTLIPGDGVGPELSESVQEIFQSCNVPVSFIEFHVSGRSNDSLIDQAVASIRKTKVCLKNHLTIPDYSWVDGVHNSANLRFRRQLDLFASIAVVKSHPCIKTAHTNMDLVVIREYLEGEYSCLEHESRNGVVESLKIVTSENSRRIARMAFDYAVKHNRKKVTAVHKANIMKLGDGLFLKCCQEISALYPTIGFESIIVDNCTMQLVSNPNQFEVLVMPNLYGNILMNLASGLVGGAGVVAGQMYSQEFACFEPAARHSYSVATGKNVANPLALISSSTNMLRHINLHDYASKIDKAVDQVLRSGKVKTKDLGGHATCSQFTKAIISNI